MSKVSVPKIIGILCPKCNEQVWSRHRHDMRYCPCGYCYVDGGRDYTRVGWGDEKNSQQKYGMPLTVEITAEKLGKDLVKAAKTKKLRKKK